MSDISIRNVRDLDRGDRGFLEAFLGRELAEEEQVTVMALSARAHGIPKQELETLLDEAVDHVRGRRQ